MTKSTRTLLLAAAACLALAGCGKKTPSGQVVATVGGKEITSIELNNELGGFQAPDAKVRKAAEQQALNAILTRKILAQAAEKAGIAKTTAFAQQEQRMHEALLIQTWQAQIAKLVPPPSKEEVDKFITDNPDMFAQRKIFSVDQVRLSRAIDPNVAKQFGQIKSIPGLIALLDANKVPHQEGHVEVDAITMDPRILSQIVKLPADEVFIVPQNNVLVANHIVSTRVEPVAPELAAKRATQIIKADRTQKAIQKQFGGVIAAAKKDVVYAKAYQPPPPPKATAPAPAAAPAKGQ